MGEPFQLVCVIGAARSGTKMLRNFIATHPDIGCVPYDINYIWRLGNEHLVHDELSPDLLTPEVKRKIIKSLSKYNRPAPFLIEKTVSNSLRVAYVNAVFPNAKFVHLIRDGRDVVESVYRQWLAPPDWRYIWEKARTFPLTDAFGYALSYAVTALKKLVVQDKGKVGSWGPRYQGIDTDIINRSLLEVCAIQWARCVKRSLTDLRDLPAGRVFTIRYEDFVQAPLVYLKEMADFIDVTSTFYAEVDLKNVSTQNIGKGLRNLSSEQLDLVLPYLEETLTLLGY